MKHIRIGIVFLACSVFEFHAVYGQSQSASRPVPLAMKQNMAPVDRSKITTNVTPLGAQNEQKVDKNKPVNKTQPLNRIAAVGQQPAKPVSTGVKQ